MIFRPIITTLISTKGQLVYQKDKVILMIQFLLPMFALALGQVYGKKEMHSKLFEKSAFIIIFVIVLAQLISTFIRGLGALSPYLYFFSVYQSLQYVPTIFVCLFYFALFSLWDNKIYKILLVILSPFIAVYTIYAVSRLTYLLFLLGLILFVTYRYFRASDN